MIFGIAIIPIFVSVGYKLGVVLENWYEIDSTFTIIGILLVIGVGGLTVYSKIPKNIKMPGDTTKDGKKPNNDSIINYPPIEVTIDQVRIAIREYSDKLPKGVFRTILVKDDNSIDFEKLAPYLGGIPYKKFYMSKETYDLFEENEKLIPVEMDMVQKAVDQYVKDHKKYPMLDFDPLHRVNYYLLLQEHYLKKAPVTQFYITDLDGLITHIRPQNKNSSQL